MYKKGYLGHNEIIKTNFSQEEKKRKFTLLENL